MNRSVRLVLLAVLGAGLLLAAAPRSASAHPMGNFTINRYSALTVGQGRVDLLYVVDMAEIPTYQELGTIRPDHSTNLTPAEQDAYTAQRAADLAGNLTLTVDGRALPLSLVGRPALSFPPGAGGLPTMRLELHWTAALGSATRGTLAYRDANYSERIGWKEIIARSSSGTALTQSSVPATDLSAALTQYRPEFLNNPPQVTSAEIVFAPGAATTGDAGTAAVPQAAPLDAMAWAQSRSDALTELINQKELPLDALLIGLVVAFGLGAAHALSPGHGKTVVAAYLVGSRGTAWHAAFLGATVTISHTIGVFVLGLIVLYASQYILPETLYPWLGFFSGLLIAGMGIAMFWQRRNAWARSRRATVPAPAAASGTPAYDPHEYAHAHGLPHEHDAHEHAHVPQLALSHAGHDHGHDHALAHSHADHDHDHSHSHGDTLAQSHAAHAHDHDHDHAPTHDHAPDHDHAHDHDHDALKPHRHGPFGREHTHVLADGQQVTIGSMLALGITGGIIPCPSALVVLLVAIASHRVGLGLLLIVAFSLGLACVLTGIGLLMVYGRGLLSRVRLSGAVWGRLPMASALAVSCLGMLIAFEALNAAGLLR
jgi:ABC-type nickel/cobalt efflux system permease component RcnA